MKRNHAPLLILLSFVLLLSLVLSGCSLVSTVRQTTANPADTTAKKTSATSEVTGDPFVYEGPTWGTYAIVGVKEEYRDALTVVTIPETHEGDPVVDLRSECFAGCGNMTSLTIPACIESIGSDVFSGCGKLTEIRILGTSPSLITIPENGLFDGAAPTLKVYVPRASLSAFCSNYTWMTYADLLVAFDPE